MNIQYTLDEIDEAARQLLAATPHKIFLFFGEMGIGKTTLIQAIAKQLGVGDTVSSPTFTFINEYLTEQGQPIYHFDLYRIKNKYEALDIGIEEYFDSGNFCFIEWSEKIKNLLPLGAVKIKLTKLSENRRIIQLENP